MKSRAAVLALLAICWIPVSCASEGRTRNLVNSMFDAWNSHDPEKVASFYTDDVFYEDVAFGVTARGTDELKKVAAGFFAGVPDLKMEVVSVSGEGNHGAVEWTFSGTDTGLYKTGKKFTVRGASLFDIRSGKFSQNKDFYDSASIMRQVGLLPLLLK